MSWWYVGDIVKIELTNGKVVKFEKGILLLSDEKNLALKKVKKKRVGKKLEIGKKPRINPPVGATKLGEMENIYYKSASKNDYYKHDFKKPYPSLYKTKTGIYIKRNNPKMYFDPNRGIVN